jgi:hypothetical protein
MVMGLMDIQEIELLLTKVPGQANQIPQIVAKSGRMGRF